MAIVQYYMFFLGNIIVVFVSVRLFVKTFEPDTKPF